MEESSNTIAMRLMNGLEAGVIGGISMLAVMVLGALWRGHVWWETPNLLGSTFYGARAFRQGPGVVTFSGSAFHIVITGTVGAVFGLAAGAIEQRRRLVLLGTLSGIVWYYFADAVLWRLVNPLVPLFAAKIPSLLAHAVFGSCLGYMGRPSEPRGSG